MKLALMTFLLPPLAGARNQTWPIIATDEEIAEMRDNFDVIVSKMNSNSPSTTCSKDMRNKMPACHQYGDMWCWATAVAAVTEYFGRSSAPQCTGLECDIVGWTFGTTCCPYEAHVKDCGSKGATLGTMTKALGHFTQKTWTLSKSALEKATLDATLQHGNPVILGIGSPSTGQPTHIVTVHGCDGNGNYWFHDPERDYGEYLKGDYNWLVNQCYAWVGDRTSQKLVHCTSGSAKLPKEIFRIERKWYTTHYITATSKNQHAGKVIPSDVSVVV